MPSENTSTSASAPGVTKLLAELEIPFPPDQVRWRVTNTSNDKKRGQIVPYADPRAYTDRLNAPRHEDALPPGRFRHNFLPAVIAALLAKKWDPIRPGDDRLRNLSNGVKGRSQ